jgi:putative Ca2+/H+ antiporter (TMEM165/GDT1 family)
MTVPEAIYVMIGVGGFLLVLEGCVFYLGKKMSNQISPDLLKFIAGLVTFAVGCILLFWGPK